MTGKKGAPSCVVSNAPLTVTQPAASSIRKIADISKLPRKSPKPQDVEQEAESGEVDQSFEVTGGGDNSNQCVGIQGVANTGNTQNVIDVVDTTGDFDDGDDIFFDFGDADGFEFDEVESSIEVNPTSTTTCDNQVNQAATASG